MEVASVCLHLLNPFDVAIGRLRALRQQFTFAEDDLALLFRDFENTRRHLENLHSFLERATLSPKARESCEAYLHDILLQVNRLEGMTELLEAKLKFKTSSVFRREKHRINAISTGLESLKQQLNKIDSNMAVIRAEILIEVALTGNEERKIEHAVVKEQLDTIEKNTKITEAKRIRDSYRKGAMALITTDEELVTDFISRAPYPSTICEPQGENNITRTVSSRRVSQVRILVPNPPTEQTIAQISTASSTTNSEQGYLEPVSNLTINRGKSPPRVEVAGIEESLGEAMQIALQYEILHDAKMLQSEKPGGPRIPC